jgi:hypothetical protein
VRKPEGLVETVSNLVEVVVSMAFSVTRLHWSAPYVTGGDALLSRLLTPREAAFQTNAFLTRCDLSRYAPDMTVQ